MFSWECPRCSGRFYSSYEDPKNKYLTCVYCGYVLVPNPYWKGEIQRMMLSRQEFKKAMEGRLQAIHNLLDFKGVAYGDRDDALFNFRATARRVLGNDDHEAMLKTLFVYMDKHLVALVKNGLEEREYFERWLDIILYSFLAMAIKDEANGMRS